MEGMEGGGRYQRKVLGMLGKVLVEGGGWRVESSQLYCQNKF